MEFRHLRKWSVATTLLAVISLVPNSFGQEPGSFDGCPLEGKTANPSLMALNRLKNRTVAPLQPDVNANISLASVLAPGNDVTRWSAMQGAVITGYVIDIKPCPHGFSYRVGPKRGRFAGYSSHGCRSYSQRTRDYGRKRKGLVHQEFAEDAEGPKD